ncbi:unnamed protein product [Closterium sp. NIES-54]
MPASRALLPCPARAALPCSPHPAALQPVHRAALPFGSRTALPCSSRAALPCPAAQRVAPCCPAQRVAPCCPTRRALLPCPARRALLPHASRPAAARASRFAALRVAPCCSQCVALCCPARRTLLPCTARALLPCPPRTLPCSLRRALPCPATPPSPAAPHCPARAALPNPSRAALPRSPAPLSRPAATTAPAGGGAAGSAGSAAGAGGARGATGSAGSAAGPRVATARGGQRQSLPLPNDPTPQQLRKWVLQRACLGGGGFGFLRTAQRRQQSASESTDALGASEFAAALGASESAAALGASESVAAPDASESAAALGARASPATGPSSAEALQTFTLDLDASRCFFRDCTTLTPLAAPVPDVWVDTFIHGGQHVVICTCSRTGHHLATFTQRPGSSLYTLTTAPAQVAEEAQVATSSRVSASGQLATSCSCRVLSHKTLLWHHCLGHPSLPHLWSMHSCLLCAAPHSSEFPPTTSPLQTRHMDIWGPALVGGTDQERYFLLVVDDYTRYTTVFPLQRKADVSSVLIPWIRATRRQLRDRFSRDLLILRLHSDRGGEFSSEFELVHEVGKRVAHVVWESVHGFIHVGSTTPSLQVGTAGR